jgi:hypothetical protein
MVKGDHQPTVDTGHDHARERAIHLECKLETINEELVKTLVHVTTLSL